MPYSIASILMRGQPSGGYIRRMPSGDGLIHSTIHPAGLGHFSEKRCGSIIIRD